MFTVPETVEALAGAVIATVGGVLSLPVLLTVTEMAALVVLFPDPSVAIAVNVCAPFADFDVSHE
jgi:hypothetical protein